jgi:amino acid/amide ABC transporter ATP-binding protein 2, HAAT family (TC 3.A.1.4.-)
LSLEVRELETGYGSTQVIWGVSISSGRSGFTAILGPNGAGKTTILNAIMGFIKPWRGVIKYNGVEITHTPPHRKVEMGINIVPEGRRLFPNMSVRENLMLASRVRRARGFYR